MKLAVAVCGRRLEAAATRALGSGTGSPCSPVSLTPRKPTVAPISERHFWAPSPCAISRANRGAGGARPPPMFLMSDVVASTVHRVPLTSRRSRSESAMAERSQLLQTLAEAMADYRVGE